GTGRFGAGRLRPGAGPGGQPCGRGEFARQLRRQSGCFPRALHHPSPSPMNLRFPSRALSGGGVRREDGIALVITLLMLSVITFLAVAFLAVTRLNAAATTASVD